MLKSKIKLVSFDVNGTLFDDTDIFLKAINGIFPRFGKEEWPIDVLRDKFGQPWTKIYREVGITENIASNDKLYEVYNEIYIELCQKNQPRPYKNLSDALAWLKNNNTILTIISSQYNKITVPLLQKYDLEKYFSEIKGVVGDKVKALKDVSQQFKVKLAEMAYLGDQEGDIGQAKKASCVSIGFASGFHLPAKIMAARPDFIIYDYAEIKKLPIFK